jgi:di-N-acetylchitobiase
MTFHLLQIWYDDPEAHRARYLMAKNLHLRGVGMWTADFVDYNGDHHAQEQAKAMWDAIKVFKTNE